MARAMPGQVARLAGVPVAHAAHVGVGALPDGRPPARGRSSPRAGRYVLAVDAAELVACARALVG
jgi:hypothetical protein